MSDQQPETLSIHLTRPDSGISWGFRLQGGFDFNTMLSIQVVQPKSIAERCGLLAGDGILQINNSNTQDLTHEEAKMEIIRSSNDIYMLVQRGAVHIWKPKVTPMSELRPQELQPIQTATGDTMHASQKTSLQKSSVDEPSSIGNQYNRSARPFAGAGPGQGQGAGAGFGGGGQQGGFGGVPPKQAVPNVVHAQFNTPIGMYSANNIAKSYSDQTAGIQRQMSDLDVKESQLGAKMTGTYQNLDENQGQDFGVPYSPTSPTGDADLPPPPVSLVTGNAEQTKPESGSPTWDPAETPASSSPPPQEHEAPKSTNPNGGPSGFRSVNAPAAKPPGQSSAPKQENMHCNGCGNLVTGVFVRVKGMPYHEKCFKCTNCGVYLKQKGYFMIEGQLYCEIHARRVVDAPGDNMRNAGAVYR